jgi:hypothetical protein
MSAIAMRCLTRVVTDDARALEVAQIQAVMSRIQSALRDIPASERDYVANALLNLAVSSLITQEGRPRTASMLMRLGDVVAVSRTAPRAEQAIDLSETHS